MTELHTPPQFTLQYPFTNILWTPYMHLTYILETPYMHQSMEICGTFRKVQGARLFVRVLGTL